MKFIELTSILQAAVSPVILISGVGLLVLSMTNRFGRVIDRSRQLGDAARPATEIDRARIRAQLEILFRRARLLRSAITLAVMSMLMAALLVIALFLTAVLHAEAVLLSVLLFIACLFSLIYSLVNFLQDLNLSLAALKLEMSSHESEL